MSSLYPNKDNIIRFFILKKSYLIFLPISIIIICFIGLEIYIIPNPLPKGSEKLINKILYIICCSYLTSFIFYIAKDYLPNLRHRKSKLLYIQQHINQIYLILKGEVDSVFFYNLSKPTITLENYITKFLERSQIKKKTIDTSYFNCLEKDLQKIKLISNDLLLTYGNYLNYNQTKKLEYLGDCIGINFQFTNLYTGNKGEILPNEDYLKLLAISIYKAYEVMRSPKFRIPKYSIEDDILHQMNLID